MAPNCARTLPDIRMMELGRRNRGKRVSVLSFDGFGDVYGRSLYPALERAGANVTAAEFSGRWLAANGRQSNCLHINWPSFFYSGRNKSATRLLIDFARFVGFMSLLRLWGLRVYWTAHNLYPHDACHIPGLDWLARQFVVRLSRKVFIHGPVAASVLEKEFPSVSGKIVLIDHGHWINFYPRSCGRIEARERIGLRRDDFVFLFIGLCKEYKNVHGLIQAFEKIDGQVRLVIAGAFQSEAYHQKILGLVSRQPPDRVLLYDGFVPDADLQYYLTAADVVVLPYQEVLTSGSAVLALSFGRPVVAPHRGHLVDLVTSECGVLYSVEASDGLLLAMLEAMNLRFDEGQIIERARLLDWDLTARKMVEAFSVNR